MISLESLQEFQQRQSWGLGDVIDFYSCHSTIIVLENQSTFQDPMQAQTQRLFVPFENGWKEDEFLLLKSSHSSKSLSEAMNSKSAQIETQKTEMHQSSEQKSYSFPIDSPKKILSSTSQRRENGKEAVTKKTCKKQPYPTKNFLQSFRASFLNYLKLCFNAQEFEKIPAVLRIRSKKSINLKDYEQIFNQARFRPFLEVYFSEKVIVRDLLHSRIEEKTKMYYLTKVYVFEEAFRSRIFRKINY